MSPRALAFVIGLAALPLMGGNCLQRQCLDDSYCTRECECTDTSRNEVFICPMTFTCDIETEYCEDAYSSLTCDDICQTYGARGLCGSKRCRSENDCLRSATCNATDNAGNPLCTYNCDLGFNCDGDLNVCEVGYLTDDNGLCLACSNSCGGDPCNCF